MDVAGRLDTEWSLPLIVAGLSDRAAAVRQAAASQVHFARLPVTDSSLLASLQQLLRDEDLAVRRTAAMALGNAARENEPLSASEVAGSLLSAASQPTNDRLVQHAVTYALIEVGDRESLARGLLDPDEIVRETAAVAIEQLRRPLPHAERPPISIPPPARSRALSAEEQQRLLALATNLPKGVSATGETVFQSDVAACSKCHRIGQRGGSVGPDLTYIGRIRNRRDLLESIVYPSATLARGFESFSIVTRGGTSFSGILLGETTSTLRIGIDKGTSRDIPIAEIEGIAASHHSIMPSNVSEQLTLQQLADLIAYLRSQK